MVYVVIEQDDGPHYFKFVTLMSAAYYLGKNNKTNYTISDYPLTEIDENGLDYEIPESSYRLI